MKAILIINVPDTDIGKEFVYRRYDGTEWVDVDKCKLMPMPEDCRECRYFKIYKDFPEDKAYIKGWNACLEEIGEQDD